MAFKNGIVGFTKKGGMTTGCACHGFDPVDSVSVRISGPASLRANDTAIYVLSIANGPAVAGGCDISTSLGRVVTSALDTTLKSEEPITGAGFELTHKDPKLFKGDTLKFYFKYIAPSTPNVTDTIFANGNSVNNDTASDNDKWNYANNFLINILSPVGISNNSVVVNSFELQQNYPNPFNPETKIQFSINKSSNLSLTVYDMNGKEVANLLNNKLFTSGDYSVTLNASQYNLTSGVYFYKLSSENFSDVKKMMLLK